VDGRVEGVVQDGPAHAADEPGPAGAEGLEARGPHPGPVCLLQARRVARG
jgi:hypothetical protein